jgi:hypothetical protein
MEIPEKPTPKYYTDAHRIAQQKYRAKNREDYNKSQRELYAKLHQDEAWRKKFNEQSAKNNLAARQKKREEILQENPDHVFKKRGRPRKTVPDEKLPEDNELRQLKQNLIDILAKKMFIQIKNDTEPHRVKAVHQHQQTIRSLQLKMDRLTEQMKQLTELQVQEEKTIHEIRQGLRDDEIAKAVVDKTDFRSIVNKMC